MQLHAYLTKSRHGIFYFRWPLPQIGPHSPRKTLRISLQTRCPVEAGMLARHLAVCGAKQRQHLSAVNMDHSVLRAKVHQYFRTQLERGKAQRNQLGPFTAEQKDELQRNLDMLDEGNREYWHLFGSDNARAELDRFFRKTSLPRDEYQHHIPTILNEIRKARIGAYKAILRHAEGLEVYDFTEPLSADVSEIAATTAPTPTEAATAPSAARSGPLLSVLFAQRKAEAEQAREWSRKLVDDYQNWIELFVELQGDRPILDYRKSDARSFKEALLGLPNNRSKLPQTRGLSALDAIEAAKTYGLDPLSTSTINKALSRMQATWKWAAKQLDDEVTDIFAPMKLTSKVSARTEADPFNKAQLQTIFNSPVFTGCKSERFRTEPGPTDMSGTSWYWLPLLGLLTGARLNELCQLRVDDVDEEDGIPFLRVHEGDETQRVKFGKKRLVPLHPELIRLGFQRFVQAQERAGHDRLFPDLRLGATGYYSDQSSKDFSRYIEKLGAKTDKTSFHSFRHNFKDACRHGGVHPDINDILLGHALSGMAGRYGDGNVDLPVLYEAVGKVVHRGLSLRHIKGHA